MMLLRQIKTRESARGNEITSFEEAELDINDALVCLILSLAQGYRIKSYDSTHIILTQWPKQRITMQRKIHGVLPLHYTKFIKNYIAWRQLHRKIIRDMAQNLINKMDRDMINRGLIHTIVGSLMIRTAYNEYSGDTSDISMRNLAVRLAKIILET